MPCGRRQKDRSDGQAHLTAVYMYLPPRITSHDNKHCTVVHTSSTHRQMIVSNLLHPMSASPSLFRSNAKQTVHQKRYEIYVFMPGLYEHESHAFSTISIIDILRRRVYVYIACETDETHRKTAKATRRVGQYTVGYMYAFLTRFHAMVSSQVPELRVYISKISDIDVNVIRRRTIQCVLLTVARRQSEMQPER